MLLVASAGYTLVLIAMLLTEHRRGQIALLRAVVRDRGMTALVATHDTAMREVADRVITLRDGQVVEDARTARVASTP